MFESLDFDLRVTEYSSPSTVARLQILSQRGLRERQAGLLVPAGVPAAAPAARCGRGGALRLPRSFAVDVHPVAPLQTQKLTKG